MVYLLSPVNAQRITLTCSTTHGIPPRDTFFESIAFKALLALESRAADYDALEGEVAAKKGK